MSTLTPSQTLSDHPIFSPTCPMDHLMISQYRGKSADTTYFDTIPHRRLIKAVKKRVADRDIRDLLWKFLRAGVMHQGTTKETLSGTPQGGIVSPLLANIYLHELDTYMESKYLNLTKVQREKRRR